MGQEQTKEWNVSSLPIIQWGFETCPSWSVTAEWQLAGDRTVYIRKHTHVCTPSQRRIFSYFFSQRTHRLFQSLRRPLSWRITVLGTFCPKTRTDVMCNFPSSDFHTGLRQQGVICCSLLSRHHKEEMSAWPIKTNPIKSNRPPADHFQLPASCLSTPSTPHQQANHLCKPA